MSIFPTRILLATDGSREAWLASKTAVELVEKTDSELHVVLVSPTLSAPEYDAMSFAIEEPREEIKREGRRRLDEHVRQIEEIGGAVARVHFRMGRPDERIIAVAEEIGAGLIVMGSRGLSGLSRALIGSVSASVVRHAHCLVLIVRAEEEEVR
jgi:nucleotide-binding universal stress UspA family protein